jgi:hypothetical protein
MPDKLTLEKLDDIIRRLDALLSLIIISQIQDKISIRNQIQILSSTGLKYHEIAKILSKSPSYVSSELTKLKKIKTKDR